MIVYSVYNAAFMGGWREGIIQSGHFLLMIDDEKTKFCAYQFGTYGSVGYIVDEKKALVLSDNEARYFNDMMLGLLMSDRYVAVTVTPEHRSIWNVCAKYPYSASRMSKNIGYGDTVVDLFDTLVLPFKVTYSSDLMALNRRANYKIVSRPVEHMEPASRKSVIDKYESISVFDGWEVCTLPNGSVPYYRISDLDNGKSYTAYYDKNVDDRMYLVANDVTYTRMCRVGQMFWGLVYRLVQFTHYKYLGPGGSNLMKFGLKNCTLFNYDFREKKVCTRFIYSDAR